MGISNTIKSGESITLEFKESMNDSAYKTISAFANTEGGTLLCGVSDDGDIIGTECSDQAIRNIIDKIANMGIYPLISPIEEKEEKILKIEIEKSYRPISYRGRYYKKVGNTTREMRGEELITFFQQWSSWDTLTGDYSIEEIDEKTFNKFIRMAVNSGRLPENETGDMLEILKRLNLIMDSKITNAAIILFGKNPQKYFANAVIRVLNFKGDISSSDRIVRGNLFEQAEGVEEAIKNSMDVKYEIKGKLSRNNIWDYPLEAIRESLLNSIIHRDYFKYGIQPQIKLLDDRIWFFNPGGLFGGLTIEDLKETHPSATRNHIISDIFYRAGFVEVYGSGIGKILGSLKDTGLPEPEFKEEFGGFSLYMFKGYTEDMFKGVGLNERQIKAMVYLNKERSISTSEYSKIVPKVSVGTLKRDLSDLVEKGFIEKVGSKKTRRYELLK